MQQLDLFTAAATNQYLSSASLESIDVSLVEVTANDIRVRGVTVTDIKHVQGAATIHCGHNQLSQRFTVALYT